MWTTYPVIEAPRLLKVYYLLQFAYWLQQTIILAARVEKPRNDFRELVIHVSPAPSRGAQNFVY